MNNSFLLSNIDSTWNKFFWFIDIVSINVFVNSMTSLRAYLTSVSLF